MNLLNPQPVFHIKLNEQLFKVSLFSNLKYSKTGLFALSKKASAPLLLSIPLFCHIHRAKKKKNPLCPPASWPIGYKHLTAKKLQGLQSKVFARGLLSLNSGPHMNPSVDRQPPTTPSQVLLAPAFSSTTQTAWVELCSPEPL